jgi:hypothetical protein
VNHKKSKCLFFKEGSVFNEDCTKTIAHCYCEIDEMEEDKPCTSDACRYYVRKKEGKKEGGAK